MKMQIVYIALLLLAVIATVIAQGASSGGPGNHGKKDMLAKSIMAASEDAPINEYGVKW